MSRPFRILHLVDADASEDTLRAIDHLVRGQSQSDCVHMLHRMDGGGRFATVSCDIRVSHLQLTGRSVSSLLRMRALGGAAPLAHMEHTFSKSYFDHTCSGWAPRSGLLKMAYRLFDRVLAVSKAQYTWLRDTQLVPQDRLYVIPPDSCRAAYRALPRPTGPVRVVGAIGRFHEQQGFDILVKAFRSLPQPDIRLMLCGEGPDKPRLQDFANGDPRIRFHRGTYPVTSMAEIDLLAIPARWQPSGSPALDAREAGRPVLVSDTDALPDLAIGRIVRDNTPDAWRVALSEVLHAPAQSVPFRTTPARAGPAWDVMARYLLSRVEAA
ncbi:glycosyltransferase family 4 protein [Sagittula sp. SSi028]|uniref:glycosyltransferase family 4 protein n=1 Tax=Sagittula sp. SSi028 TaxID=3400636 RepID=UPI003AF4C015